MGDFPITEILTAMVAIDSAGADNGGLELFAGYHYELLSTPGELRNLKVLTRRGGCARRTARCWRRNRVTCCFSRPVPSGGRFGAGSGSGCYPSGSSITSSWSGGL